MNLFSMGEKQYLINLLIRVVMENNTLTDGIFSKYGISFDDVSFLLKKGILVLEYDKYYLKDKSLLFKKGFDSLLANNDFDSAWAYFLKCYNLFEDDRDVRLMFLLLNLMSSNFDAALEVLSKLVVNENISEKLENNLFIYLIGKFRELPPSISSRLDGFDIRKVTNIKSFSSDGISCVLELIVDDNLDLALLEINQSLDDRLQNRSVSTYLLKVILARINYYKVMSSLTLLARYGYFGEIVLFLKQLEEKRQLTDREKCILLALDKIINGFCENTSGEDVSKLYDCIRKNDFQNALNLNDEYLKRNRILCDDDLLTYLLTLLSNIKCRHKAGGDSIVSDGIQNIINKLEADDSYNEVILVLKLIGMSREFTEEEACLLKILEVLKKVIETGEIPEIILGDDDSLYGTLLKNDFQTAKNLRISYLRSMGLPVDSDWMYKLIKKLMSAINTNKSASINREQMRIRLVEIFRNMKQHNSVFLTYDSFSFVDIKLIEEILNEDDSFYPELKMLRIWRIDSNSNIIILNRISSTESNIDIDSTLLNIYKLFNEKRYKDCFDAISRLLSSSKYKFSLSVDTRELFYIYGMCNHYIYGDNKVSVKKYFGVVTALNKALGDDEKYDYSCVLASVRTEKTSNEKYFVFGVNMGYEKDLKKLEDILYEAIEFDIPLLVSFSNYSLEDDEIQLIQLIQARDFYVEKKYDEGDSLLQEVQGWITKANKNDIRVQFVKKVFKYLEKKKKFFCKMGLKIRARSS